MEFKFNIGDRVIVNSKHEYQQIWQGAKGTVTELSYAPFVKMDIVIDDWSDRAFDENELDLIDTESLSKSELIQWLTANPKATRKQILEYLNSI